MAAGCLYHAQSAGLRHHSTPLSLGRQVWRSVRIGEGAVQWARRQTPKAESTCFNAALTPPFRRGCTPLLPRTAHPTVLPSCRRLLPPFFLIAGTPHFHLPFRTPPFGGGGAGGGGGGGGGGSPGGTFSHRHSSSLSSSSKSDHVRATSSFLPIATLASTSSTSSDASTCSMTEVTGQS